MSTPSDENARLRQRCERLEAQLDAVARERDQWKVKHDDVVARARMLIDSVSKQFGSDVDPKFSTSWPWPVSLTDEDVRKIAEGWKRPGSIVSGYRAGERVHYVAEVPGMFGVARIQV